MIGEHAESYDVVVVGGGPAGLAGALMLGRSRRSVLVIDDGHPRNAPAAGVHGYLGREGIAPAELLAIGHDEVRHYGVETLSARVESARAAGDGFVVELADARTVRARRLLVTTGLTDQLPELPGMAERWGRDVLHCPYCHGWEVRDRAIVVLGLVAMSAHQAQLFRQLSDRVTYLVHDAPVPDAEQRQRLDVRGITVVDGRAAGLEVIDDALVGLRLTTGELIGCDAVVIGARVKANSAVLSSLGVGTEAHPSGMGEFVPADETGRTSVPGVYVAGNVTTINGQVSTSASAGAWAGAMINMNLIEGEIETALESESAAASASELPSR